LNVISETAVLPREFSAKEIQHSFSETAWFYDFWARLTESKAERRVLELADIQDGESALEVAVGTGILFEEVVLLNRGGRNEDIDISMNMLSRTAKRLAKHTNAPYNLHFGSAYDLPFMSNAFDLILNDYMLDLLPESDFDRILSEFYRVLKPTGRVVITTMSYGKKWYNRFWFLLAKYYPSLLTNCRPISVQNNLTDAGFEDINVETLSQNTFPSQILTAKKGSH
jgi:ubiquinone/menaquinone biosynthesis C-methylase UbiE